MVFSRTSYRRLFVSVDNFPNHFALYRQELAAPF